MKIKIAWIVLVVCLLYPFILLWLKNPLLGSIMTSMLGVIISLGYILTRTK